MTKHRQLVYGQPVPQSFLDALQEFIGTMGSPNLDLTMVPGSQNQIQIIAGTGSAQVGLAIDGLWRYISVTAGPVAVPAGAGTYDVFVTTGNNSFATNPSPPPPETDSTDYTFTLATPLLQGNTPGAAHWRKIGEAVSDGTRVTSLRQTIDVDGATVSQPGDIKLSAAAVPAAGWLLCNGQAVSRTTFSALYAALGGTTSPWGQGDGSTTFNVPDLRSRAPIGAGQGSGLANRALGSASGEENHTLSNGEMPQHSHGGATGGGTSSTGGDHTHWTVDNALAVPAAGSWPQAAGGANITAGAYPFMYPGASFGTHTQTSTVLGGGHAHSVPALGIGLDGGSVAHNNMPPWVAVNYFVKT